MTIPDSTPDAVIEAMRRFDKDFRDTAEWQKWKEDANYKPLSMRSVCIR
jgi:hypothetical protein